jgi:acyl carrier protein
MASVAERVKAITARVLGIDPGEIKPEHSFAVDLGAESVDSVELAARFEEEFGIKMDEDEALSSTSSESAKSRAWQSSAAGGCPRGQTPGEAGTSSSGGACILVPADKTGPDSVML